MINNSFVFSAASLSTAVNVGANTAPETFSFATNLWYAADDPARSAPVLPVTATGGISGMRSAYEQEPTPLPDDPFAPVAETCIPEPEGYAATPLPEIEGTLFGSCRAADHRSIGPAEGCPPI